MLDKNIIILTHIRSGGTIIDHILSHIRKNDNFYNFYQYVLDAINVKGITQENNYWPFDFSLINNDHNLDWSFLGHKYREGKVKQKIFKKTSSAQWLASPAMGEYKLGILYDLLKELTDNNFYWSIRFIIPELLNLKKRIPPSPIIHQLFSKILELNSTILFLYRQDIEDWFLSWALATKNLIFHSVDLETRKSKKITITKNDVKIFIDDLLFLKLIMSMLEYKNCSYIAYENICSVEDKAKIFNVSKEDILSIESNTKVTKLYSKNEKLNLIENWNEINTYFHDYCNYVGFYHTKFRYEY